MDWIDLYNRKSLDKFDVRNSWELIKDDKRGFCQIRDDGETLFV